MAALDAYCEEVAAVGTTPPATAMQQSALSQAARATHTVVVLNMCERGPDGASHYDTSVAFSPDGTVLASYRKFNLFSGDFLFNRTAHAVPTVFDTPFGRFGMFICFDLVYRDPPLRIVQDMGVHHVLYSTDWINGHDYVGSMFQRGFAMANGVNLIAANDATCPEHCGGGVYSGGRVLSSYFSLDHTFAPSLTMADLPTLAPGPPAALPGPLPSLGRETVGTFFDCGHGTFSCTVFNATAGLTGVVKAVSSYGTVCEGHITVGAHPAHGGTVDTWVFEAYHYAGAVPHSPSFVNSTARELRRCSPGGTPDTPCPRWPSTTPVVLPASATCFTDVTIRASGLGFQPNTSSVMPVFAGNAADVSSDLFPVSNFTHTAHGGGTYELRLRAANASVTLFSAAVRARLSPL